MDGRKAMWQWHLQLLNILDSASEWITVQLSLVIAAATDIERCRFGVFELKGPLQLQTYRRLGSTWPIPIYHPPTNYHPPHSRRSTNNFTPGHPTVDVSVDETGIGLDTSWSFQLPSLMPQNPWKNMLFMFDHFYSMPLCFKFHSTQRCTACFLTHIWLPPICCSRHWRFFGSVASLELPTSFQSHVFNLLEGFDGLPMVWSVSNWL